MEVNLVLANYQVWQPNNKLKTYIAVQYPLIEYCSMTTYVIMLNAINTYVARWSITFFPSQNSTPNRDCPTVGASTFPFQMNDGCEHACRCGLSIEKTFAPITISAHYARRYEKARRTRLNLLRPRQ